MITEVTMKRGVRMLARELGCSPSSVSKVANGKKRLGRPMAEKLRLMGITIPGALAPAGMETAKKTSKVQQGRFNREVKCAEAAV